MLKTRTLVKRQDVFRIEQFDCYLWEKKKYLARIAISQNGNMVEATRQHEDPVEAIWKAFCAALSWKHSLLKQAELFRTELHKNQDGTNTVNVLFVGNGITREGEGRDSNSYRAIAEALVSGVNNLP